jgi:thiol-disulfide isomerase/thioredoxin
MKSYLVITPLVLGLLAASCDQQAQVTTDILVPPAETAQSSSQTEITNTTTGSSSTPTTPVSTPVQTTTNQGIAIGEPHPQSPDNKPPVGDPVLTDTTPEDDGKPLPTIANGTYEAYSTEALTAAQSKNRKVVLFFHATWCPECREADKDFTSNLNKIPSNVSVFKVDYDSSKDLKTKYGITHQHTFVQIDSEGTQITKWVGGGVDNLIKYIK